MMCTKGRILLSGFLLVFVVNLFAQIPPAKMDSSYWYLSLPELQSYKAYYIQELESLYEEKRNLIRRGIDDGERLLASKPDYKVIDEILVRLADLYYYQAKDQYLTEMESFDNAIFQYERGEITQLPEEPKMDYSSSLNIYQRIIDEFPQSELIDDAIYNKGFLYEEMIQKNKAIQVYKYLIDAYPKSQYVPESYMRLGESYFNPPNNDLDQALQYYKKVLDYPKSPRYDEALYKMGWTYYRLSEYPQAISYFTTLVEGTENLRKGAQEALENRADLYDEALEYMAISFIDFGGESKAASYLTGSGNPRWGWDMLNTMGDAYMQQKEEYLLAVETYQRLLNYDPIHQSSPEVQKKIIDCYRILEDEQAAFSERQKLFVQYRAGSTWWNANTNEEVKLRAYRLAESSARDNINYMMKKSKDLNSAILYQKTLELGQSYLNSFPEDMHAYMVRWNVALILDTKLHRYKEALQEYLTISMVYNSEQYEEFARNNGLASIQDAAANAIVVADTLVAQEKRLVAKQGGSQPIIEEQGVLTERDPVPLTASESWLAMSYDNFIKLFPFDENTPQILSNAGALYYTHNQFTEALRYFKTLIKYFPQSEEVDNAQYAILESYFGKQDFQSVELLAKRILQSNASDEIKDKARKRMGEAIFLNAELLSTHGAGNKAAEEYFRMATEVPNAEFADRALFNAGQEYDKANQYGEAIRTYELLKSSYPASSYMTDALNNLAYNYGELGNFQKAAENYEMFYNKSGNEKEKQDALYNAWIFYVKAENWQKALTTGKLFATTYSDAKEATTVYFRCGEYAQNLKAYEVATHIFEDFAVRFPNTGIAVEAFYRLGTIQQELGDTDKAVEFYNRAYLKNESLKSSGQKANAFFAAEALFMQATLNFQKFQQIKFRQPEHVLQSALRDKEQLLNSLVDQYTKIVRFGTERLPEALYKIGQCHEIYAQDWANQELPALNDTEGAVKEKEINARSTQIYSQALGSYTQADNAIANLIRKTRLSAISDSSNTQQTDSLIALSSSWRDRSRAKISETLYQMADLNEKSVNRLLAVPVPDGLSPGAELEYRSQVLIKAVKPTLDIVVEAHFKNVHVSDSLGLTNNWVDSSKSKIVASLGIMGDAYGDLSFQSLYKFRSGVSRFRRLSLGSEQVDTQELSTSNLNILDLTKSYALASIAFYRRAYNRLVRERFVKEAQSQIQESMIHFVTGLSDSLWQDKVQSIADQEIANQKFAETENFYYEEALAAFEDHDYFIDEKIKTILETAWGLEKQFDSSSPSMPLLVIRLVKIMPDQYARELNITFRNVEVNTDTTWFYHTAIVPGWNTTSFDDSGWNHPGTLARQMGTWDSRYVQTLSVVDSLAQTKPSACLLRKSFAINGYPVSCDANILSDARTKIFCNGQLIAELNSNKPLNFRNSLKSGENVVAIAGVLNSSYIVEGQIKIQYIQESDIARLRR